MTTVPLDINSINPINYDEIQTAQTLLILDPYKSSKEKDKDLSDSQLIQLFNTQKDEYQDEQLDEPHSLPDKNNRRQTHLHDTDQHYSQKQILIPNTKSENNKKKLGRKRKRENDLTEEDQQITEGEHNKNSFDNQCRKIKNIYKNALLEFINSKIEEFHLSFYFVGDEGQKIEFKELKNIENSSIKDTRIEFNKDLFKKTIKEFLSQNINGRFIKFPINYNELFINKIYEEAENNNTNAKKITDILNITFLECFKYYRQDKNMLKDEKGKEIEKYKCLKGLEEIYSEQLESLKKKEGEKYFIEINNLIKGFEVEFESRKGRQGREKKNSQ